MPSDRSRRTDPTRYGYTGVVAQQGRVILDRDFNAQQGLTADRIAADALDFVGPCGTPDDGFRIRLPGGSPPPPPFWSPPVTPSGSPPQEAPGGRGDFLIGPGTMYVGGQRVMLPAEQNGKAITYSYLDQPDWALPPRPRADQRYELAFLELVEMEVGAVEDPDQLEVALGGPDTTQRLKLLRRVSRMTVDSANCTSAWAMAMKRWQAQGWQFDPATMRLRPLARLKVGFTQDAGSGDPCDPVATGGYLGADNQLIRARIAGSGGNTSVVWGYDNASFLYRVTSVSTDGTMLTLASDPPDGFHVPQQGQWVEVLTTAAVFAEEPDETDPTGQSEILRVAAEIGGTLCQLNQAYGPVATGDPTNYIVLTEALAPAIATSSLPVFLRVWQASLPLSAAGGTVTLSDPTTGVSTGVTATISLQSGTTLPDDVFWQIAVRPATPQGVYPEDLLISPQPPDGPRRWVCPLAVIDWHLGKITDCRSKFDNLVTLTRRRPGCCTVSIAQADLSATVTLQTLIDAAAAVAQAQSMTVTVCLSGGPYLLAAPLRLDARHDCMTLESCGGIATLSADPAADASLFLDGLVVLTNANCITLRHLHLQPPQCAVPAAQVGSLLKLLSKDLSIAGAGAVFGNPTVSFGVRVLTSPNLTLDGCSVLFVDTRADRSADLFAAAVFVQGVSTGLTIRGCDFVGQITPTYTVIDVTAKQAAPDALVRFNDAANNLVLLDAPSSPPATSPSVTSQVDSQMSASLDLLVAKRLAVDLASRSAVIATAGVVADAYSAAAANNAADLGCSLGDVTIRDTSFTGLTVAVMTDAAMTSLRLQDNDVSAAVMGFFVSLPGAVNPSGVMDGTDLYYPKSLQFEELILAAVLAGTAPPPIDPSMVIASSNQAEANLEVMDLPLSLIVSGNQVQMRSGTANSALLFLLNTVTYGKPAVGNQIAWSVIIAANRLSSPAGEAVPVALLTLSEELACSITGNVVINQTSAADPSLWLIVEGSVNRDIGVPLLSATGNVLRGKSDLSLMTRPGNPAPPAWSTYNAIQT